MAPTRTQVTGSKAGITIAVMLGAHHAIGPFQQLLAIVRGHIDYAHEDFDRQVLGELRHELAASAGAQLFDETDGQLACFDLECRHGLGRECRIDQGPVSRMRRRVGENRVQRDVALAALGHCQHAAGEMGVVGEDGMDILAASRHPVTAVARRPENVRAVLLVQSLEGQLVVLLRPRRVVDVEIEDQVRRDVRRDG